MRTAKGITITIIKLLLFLSEEVDAGSLLDGDIVGLVVGATVGDTVGEGVDITDNMFEICTFKFPL
jgi:hypothetical protein